MSIYPNPASTQALIESIQTENATMQVFNIAGKLISESEIKLPYLYKTNNLENGIYYIKIENERMKNTVKLQVQH